MRHIGNVPTEFDAVRLGDHLYMMGVDVQVEPVGGIWEVWVRDEDKVDVARTEWAVYCQSPRDPRYDAAQAAALKRRTTVVAEQQRVRERVVEFRDLTSSPARRGRRPLVTLLLILCAGIFLFTDQGANDSSLRNDLLFAKVKPNGRAPADGWAAIRGGEVWRLVTPVFVHFGWAHLIMNTLALSFLGGPIEERRGTAYLAALVVLLAIVSNVAQYQWTHSPYFGGISGVCFGLFGYLWMMSEFRPEAGFVLSRESVVMTMVFYALCMLSGLEALSGTLGKWMPAIANASHTGGLLLGMAWGFFDARRG